jgi:hypothetical protein
MIILAIEKGREEGSVEIRLMGHGLKIERDEESTR